MTRFLFFRVILTWLLFLPVPIINGTLREFWYKKYTGDLAAGQIGVVILSAVFVLVAYLMMNSHMAGLTTPQLLLIGLIWLILTLVFEFGLGLAGGRSWSYMLADYNVLKGRIWPLVLATVFFSPFLVKWFANR